MTAHPPPLDVEAAFEGLAASLDAAPEHERARVALRVAARVVEVAAYAIASTPRSAEAPALILVAERLLHQAERGPA